MTSTGTPAPRKAKPGAFAPTGPDAERTARHGFPVLTTEGPSSAAVRATRSTDPAVRAAGLAFLASR